MNKSLLIKAIANCKFSLLAYDKLERIFAIIKEPKATKVCPVCGYNKFASFSSLQYKQCTGCWSKFEWKLEEKEQPLVKHQR